MFNLSYTSPCDLQGTIILTEKPWRGLGVYTDINGKRWDIRGVIGEYIQACPLDSLHPYYTDTSGAQYGLVQQRWLPYKWELEGEHAQIGEPESVKEALRQEIEDEHAMEYPE